jgi:cytochrome c biogenesis protein CcmG/thiol:disulfide interchange protein DsbE
MKISISKFIVFIFAIFFLFVFWQGLKKNNNYDTKNLIGTKISNFQLSEINSDNKISSDDLKNNKFTLINFFASWCAPCRAEHKYLLDLSNKKIKIVGINFKDKKSNAINFLKDLGNPYDFVGKDFEGKTSILFGIYGIPESILLDKDLIIIKKVVGPIDDIQYDEILKLIQ